jgi:maltoporin
MKRMLYTLLLCTVAATLRADESAEALRREFETYREQSEMRIQALENGAASEGYSRTESLDNRTTRDFEFHGYFRAGLGINDEGDPMEAFQAPNADTKYRLGNEAEAYLEATYKQNFRTEALMENEVDFFTVLTLAYFTPTVDNNAFDTTTSLREAYAGARGVWDARKEALFWAGNRFYEHLDIHITDYFYRDMAGFGGGIEDVLIGDEVKWALAWLGGSIDDLDSSGTAYENDYHFNKNTIDLRLYDIRTGLGTLALTADLTDFSGDVLEREGDPDLVIDDSLGWALGAFLNSELTDTLANRFTIQYGEGAADNFRAVITGPKGIDLTDPGLTALNIDDTRRLRITDDVVIDAGNPLSLQALAAYERYDNGADTASVIDWVSLGARPVYHFNTYFSLAFEAGADYTHQKDGPEGVLGKFTLAPQIQPAARHFSRPSIRAFATYAVWSDGFEGSVAPISYGSDTQGFSFGVQMEAWW